MRVYSLWIHNTPFSLKRVLAIYALLFLIMLGLLHNAPSHIFFLYVGQIIFFSILLCFLAYTNGIYLLHAAFTDSGHKYQVRSFIFFRNFEENFLEIFLVDTLAILSRVYLNKQKKWAFFDIIRVVLEKQKKAKKILILGGGGGAVAKTVIDQFPDSHVTVVEISQKMIEIAHKFFLQKTPNITFIHGDAFDFIRTTQETFDFIFLDIFDGPSVHPKISNTNFMKKLFTTGKTLFVNFGFDYSTLAQHTRLYRQYIQLQKERKFPLYLFGKNVVGVTASIPELQSYAFRLDTL